MTTANGTSHGGVGSAAAVTEELLQGSGSGSAPPPPPPPTPGNVDPRVIRDQIKAQQRQLRDARVQSTKAKIGRVNRQYWAYAGVLVAGALGVVACRSYQADQKDTALALAQIANGGRAATAETQAPATTIVDGIPNPLQALPLSNQAKWNIGAGGDGVLPPKRSTTVITALLERVDLCNVWVGLNDKANVVVAFEPAPGFTPLLEAGQCADTQGQTVVPVPSDPVPTSSTVAQ